MLAIHLSPFRLAVRPIGTADIRTFVPLQAKPAQGIEDHLLACGDKARAIGVFNAQHKSAPALAGIDKVDEADISSADMGVTGRRRSNANTDGGEIG